MKTAEILVKDALVSFDYNGKARTGKVVVSEPKADYIKLEMSDAVKTFNISRIQNVVRHNATN